MPSPDSFKPTSSTPKGVVSIDDLSDRDIDALFDAADNYLSNEPNASGLYCARGKQQVARGKVLATLFYEPSTRTRLSFEAAALRLGADVLSSPQALSTSSATKGETIGDTARVIGTYADAIVIRHPLEGAAEVAANFAGVPVINAGDGEHEHPTQTLCDLFTIRRGRIGTSRRKRSQRTADLLKGVRVIVKGDLKHGRTVHSLVYALARFGAVIVPMPAPGCELPAHVVRRLAQDYKCTPQPAPDELTGIDVIYVVPDEPNQLTLLDGDQVGLHVRISLKSIDFVYATRLQTERLRSAGTVTHYSPIDRSFVKGPQFQKTQVLHPLPRVNELSHDLDSSSKAVYFQQAAYGVPVRMALLSALLLDEPSLDGPIVRYPMYSNATGIRCTNQQCISREDAEQRYLDPRFLVVQRDPVLLRCKYCDHEYSPHFVSNLRTKKYTTIGKQRSRHSEGIVFFANEAEARSAGHTPGRNLTDGSRSSE